MNRESIKTSDEEWRRARTEHERAGLLIGMLGLIVLGAWSIPVMVLASAITSGAARYLVGGALLAGSSVPFVLVAISLGEKKQRMTNELMDGLQRKLTASLEQADQEGQRRDAQARQQEFETRLANALEMAEGEDEVIEVVERAFSQTLPDSPVELLLADNSHAHLARMASSSPTGEPPMCTVDSPDRCPAARRAQIQRFADSDALDACPKLRGRAQGRCSAVCVPVSIMGRTVGVIHATGRPDESFEEPTVQDLATLANLAGARVGLLRMVADTQMQASTDSLTGLLNRRSLENKVRALRNDRTSFALVMADLDHFKQLNDTYGHETGDRALRLFAQTLSSSLRSQDLVSRHGGEEFAVVLPSCSATDAEAILEKVRTNLKVAVAAAGLPVVTASFGVVDAHDDEDLGDVLARADAALFQAKHDGRDRIVVHDAVGAAVESSDHAGVDRALRTA